MIVHGSRVFHKATTDDQFLELHGPEKYNLFPRPEVYITRWSQLERTKDPPNISVMSKSEDSTTTSNTYGTTATGSFATASRGKQDPYRYQVGFGNRFASEAM